MIEQLISRVFMARDRAHRLHWRTQSYARHQALGEFYEGAIEALDALVEAYQGAFGLIGEIPDAKAEQDDCADYLRCEAEWIEANRDEIANGHNALMNLVDSLTAIYLKTAYKLENLS